MREKISNVNFFVIDKNGTPIYINNALDKSVENVNARELENNTWRTRCEVIKTGEQITREEKSLEGKHYLSVKSPLVINGEVEGVIGLSVDITDRKKKEEVENKLKMEKELYKLTREVAHDICSPLSELEMVKYMSLDKLAEQERKMFELSIRRIKDITNKLIERYKGGGNIEIETKEREGTEFIVTFPKAERPRWFEDKIEIKKGEEEVVLDDELLVHEVW
ncbi:MAG: PAS domain-containing protein, partial [Endomicrobium sp.]|nr:PAS domain-containing protein [Endomicrobium sp.]